MPRRAQSASSATAPTSAATTVISADVEIADVAHLVRDDALQFLAIQRIEQPARDRDRRVPRTAAGRERVRIRVGHDVDGRPRQAGRDRHLVDDVLAAAAV